MPEDAAFQITAELPDGSIEPLLWFEHYHAKFAHPFLYRNPIELPAGTKIHGVPQGSTVLLLPGGCRARRRLLQLLDRNVEVGGVHHALALELHPDAIGPRPRKIQN